MRYYYVLSIFLSAFLLFLIQPMIGKFILPWFGGTPTVWSTVLLFSQALLTGGYAYAYWLLGRLHDRQQGVVHLSLLGISLAVLLGAALTWPSPLTPDASWRPQSANLPVWDVLKVLAAAIGIPYFLLSSNSTLMQAWFSRDLSGQTPYRLYALSNTGSLLALISYPIIFEPNLTVRAQAYLWSVGYVVFVILAAFLAFRTHQRMKTHDEEKIGGNQLDEDKRPGIGMHVLWIGLAACASTLLIAVTNQITQEVAVIPFLWVVPLALYLLTFILAFSGGRLYSRRLYLIAFFVISFASVWMLVNWVQFSITTQIIVYLLLLFICCMLCHNELFKLRPHTRFLPSFYLMVALGGALGGIYVTLLAQYLFSTGFWELQWALVASGALLVIIMQLEPAPAQRKGPRKPRQRGTQPRRSFKPAVLVSAAGVLLLSAYVVSTAQSISPNRVLATRSFYGVVRVWELNPDQPEHRAHLLSHGRTGHGFQFDAKDRRDQPTTYYTENSGVGLALLNHPARPGKLRIGALGLGIGIIASYGQPGDDIRFYELNPDIIRLAGGQGGYFSFLSDSQAEIHVVPGDARVSLERELVNDGPQNFDLLVLDAFSSDAVPVHLLTQEAFEIYLRHLKQDGIIAVNVSNRYFKLNLEVYRLADELNLDTALIQDVGQGVSYDSIWMLLTRNRGFLQLPAIANRSVERPPIPAGLQVWTDDYSNLLQILN